MAPHRQQEKAIALLGERGMMRLSELVREGVTASTVSRLEERGLVTQLARGLYQLPDAALDANHTLAEVAKLVPKGVICLDSALAFHDLTDRIPARAWVAIGPREWRPTITQPPVHIMRFPPRLFPHGVRQHVIENVSVAIYEPAKTIVDLFYHARRKQTRYGSTVGLTHALQGMKEALRLRKATPAEIARHADEAGIWKAVQPYLEAITVNA